MIRTLPRTLLVVLATTASLPAAAPAQPAAPAHVGEPPPDALTTRDHTALTAAQKLATELSQVLEKWITTNAFPADQMFARLYFPIAEPRYPRRYKTPYTELADRNLATLATLVGLENEALASSPTFLYAILTDSNGYVFAQNEPPAPPLNHHAAQDYPNDRTRQLLGDTASVLAARSELPYLRQLTRLDTGDEIYDLSVPVTIGDKRWGCVRIGYRRSE